MAENGKSKEAKTTLELTDREAQILADAIRFVWKSGAVQTREGATELISLEDKLVATIIEVKDKQHGES